jgi:hypothetical protein
MRISGKPRAAHCIGCGVTFEKMHLKIHHRRSERCGGRFLPEIERNLYDKAKHWFEAMLRAEKEGNNDEYRRCFDNRQTCLNMAYTLRKHRLDRKRHEQAA